jgi:hypothetical protein
METWFRTGSDPEPCGGRTLRLEVMPMPRLVSSAAMLLLCSAAAGQTPSPVGDEFQVNSHTPYAQTDPVVGVGPGGEFVVVWESYGSSGGDYSWDIVAQRFDSGGHRLGGELQVNSYAASIQRDPAVATGPEGELVVVWSSWGSSGTDSSSWSVQGRRFASDGMPMGGEFQVNSLTTNSQQSPSVAVGPGGDFVVTWGSYWSGGSDQSFSSIQARRFLSSGSSSGGELQVNSYTTDLQSYPSVAAGPGTEFVVAWTSYGSTGPDQSEESVQGRRLSTSGTGGYSPCVADATTLCIDGEPGDGRFEVRLHYESVLGGGVEGDAGAIPLDAVGVTRGGLLYYSNPENPELLIKILDGCRRNGHFWLFYSATTTLGFDLVVTDTFAGRTLQFTNPDQNEAIPVADTKAFDTCDVPQPEAV